MQYRSKNEYLVQILGSGLEHQDAAVLPLFSVYLLLDL